MRAWKMSGPLSQLLIFCLLVITMINQAVCSSILDTKPHFIKSSGILSDMKMLIVPNESGGPIMALSPGGKYLAVTGGRSKSLVIFDVDKEKIIKEIPRKENRINGDRLVFSPDGRYLAVDRKVWPKTDGPKQPVVTLIDAKTFEIVQQVGENCCSSSLFTFSPDSKYLLIDGPVRNHAVKALDLIDTQTWKSVHQVINKPGPEALEFTLDGKYIIDLYEDGDDFELSRSDDGLREYKLYYNALRVWDANNLKLIQAMKGVEDRAATFVCVIAIAVPGGDALIYKGRCDGLITREPAGDQGFGYDPVFYYSPLHKTFAQMPAQEKNSVSHRGRAMSEVRNEFDKVLTWLRQNPGLTQQINTP